MLEFFSLYRGYGLSLAFLSGLMYYFSRLYFEGYQQKLLVKGVLFSVLAIYSNFALLFPVFVIQLSYFIYLNKDKNILSIIKSNTTLIFVVGSVLLIPAVSNILILSEQKELYFGGDTSFIKDSLDSVVNYTFFTKNEMDEIIIKGILLFLFFTGLFFTKNKKIFGVMIIILGIVFLSIFLNFAAGSKFVIGRVSLYLIPFMTIFIMLMCDNPIKHKAFKTVVLTLIIFISVSAVKKMETSCNFDRTTTWKHDVDNKNVLKDILKSNNNKDFTLAVFWIFQYPLEYYADYHDIKELKALKKLEDEPIKTDADFYYIRTVDLKNTTFEYVVVKEYTASQTVLIKKK